MSSLQNREEKLSTCFETSSLITRTHKHSTFSSPTGQGRKVHQLFSSNRHYQEQSTYHPSFSTLFHFRSFHSRILSVHSRLCHCPTMVPVPHTSQSSSSTLGRSGRTRRMCSMANRKRRIHASDCTRIGRCGHLSLAFGDRLSSGGGIGSGTLGRLVKRCVWQCNNFIAHNLTKVLP